MEYWALEPARFADRAPSRRLIDYHRGQLTITDRIGLEAVACEDYRHSRDAYSRMFDQLETRVPRLRMVWRS